MTFHRRLGHCRSRIQRAKLCKRRRPFGIGRVKPRTKNQVQERTHGAGKLPRIRATKESLLLHHVTVELGLAGKVGYLAFGLTTHRLGFNQFMGKLNYGVLNGVERSHLDQLP